MITYNLQTIIFVIISFIALKLNLHPRELLIVGFGIHPTTV